MTGRYCPSISRLLERRRRRIVDAAFRFEETYSNLQDVRRCIGRGTPECRKAIRARSEAKRSLLYHVRGLHEELRRQSEELNAAWKTRQAAALGVKGPEVAA